MDGLVQLLPVQWVYWIAGVLLTGAGTLLVYLVKTAFGLLQDTYEELRLQRTNCLTTIQAQGKEQIALLREISESVSYLRGKNDAS